MDSVKKLEEINATNDGLFEGLGDIWGNVKNKVQTVLSNAGSRGYLTKNSNGGYFLNGNPVGNMGGDGVENPFEQATWNLPEFEWLMNSKFQATYIRVVEVNKQPQIQFQGNWIEGEFKGANFGGTNSTFGEKGKFNGGVCDSPNANFKAPPENFINGRYTDNKNGILGRGIHTTVLNNVQSIELIEVAVGWNVLLQGDKGKKVYFKVVKKLDANSTDFILEYHSAPPESNKQIIIKWETIRANYANNGFIKVGASFNLMGSPCELIKVTSISVTNEEPNVPVNLKAKNIIDFSTDKKLKIPFKFQVSVNSAEAVKKVQEVQSLVTSGNFYQGLNKLRYYIANGEIDGYNDVKWVFLKPVFNNVEGENTLVSDEVKNFMQQLNDIIEIVTLNSRILKESRAGSLFVDILKKFLKIDKYIGKNIAKKPIKKSNMSNSKTNSTATPKANQAARLHKSLS